jgi:hypothetical protein
VMKEVNILYHAALISRIFVCLSVWSPIINPQDPISDHFLASSTRVVDSALALFLCRTVSSHVRLTKAIKHKEVTILREIADGQHYTSSFHISLHSKRKLVS